MVKFSLQYHINVIALKTIIQCQEVITIIIIISMSTTDNFIESLHINNDIMHIQDVQQEPEAQVSIASTPITDPG